LLSPPRAKDVVAAAARQAARRHDQRRRAAPAPQLHRPAGEVPAQMDAHHNARLEPGALQFRGVACRVYGLGFGVQGSGFRVWGVGCRV